MIRNKNKKLALISLAILIGIIVFGLANVAQAMEGSGTPENPYQITDCTDLQAMENNLSASYILNNDIDCSETNTWNYDCDGGDYYCGFDPIGNYAGLFVGSLNGNNHTINNLFINRDAIYVGLFGYTFNSNISNVGLENVNISAGYNTGSLVGTMSDGTVSNSYSTGSVSAIGNSVGGLVGDGVGLISNSYFTGSVTAENYVGGLVGDGSPLISNSYSTGSVSGNINVGGLIGCNFYGTISNSYSTGSVSGNINVGGLVGTLFGSSTITNSYWFDVPSDDATDCYDGGNDGCSSISDDISYFYNIDNSPMDVWDFVAIWGAWFNGIKYPPLLWQDTTTPTNIGISSITADSTSQLTIVANTATDSESGLHATPYYFDRDNGTANSGWQTSIAWVDTGLSCKTQYTYKVKARDIAGNISAYSSTSSKYTTSCGGGGIPSEWYSPPAPPEGGFKLTINPLSLDSSGLSAAAKTTNSKQVALSLKGGPNTKMMAISNTSDFKDIGQELYQTSKPWNICNNKDSCQGGQYTVYAKFYAPWGTSSETVSDTIIYKEDAITSKTICDSISFTRNLKKGMIGSDIKCLQALLNSNPDTRLTDSGFGSFGKETNFFGLLTRSAVIRFQEKYKQDILFPLGLTEGTGYVGEYTRNKLNKICGE